MVAIWTEIEQVLRGIDLGEKRCLGEVLNRSQVASFHEKRVTTPLTLPRTFFHHRSRVDIDRAPADIAFTPRLHLYPKGLPALLAKLTILSALFGDLATVLANTIFTATFRNPPIVKRVSTRPGTEKPSSDFLKALCRFG